MNLRRLARDVDGATMVEYALILALFALTAAVGFAAIATNANKQYNNGTSAMTSIQENALPAVSP